jgi:hypothetical protein
MEPLVGVASVCLSGTHVWVGQIMFKLVYTRFGCCGLSVCLPGVGIHALGRDHPEQLLRDESVHDGAGDSGEQSQVCVRRCQADHRGEGGNRLVSNVAGEPIVDTRGLDRC